MKLIPVLDHEKNIFYINPEMVVRIDIGSDKTETEIWLSDCTSIIVLEKLEHLAKRLDENVE